MSSNKNWREEKKTLKKSFTWDHPSGGESVNESVNDNGLFVSINKKDVILVNEFIGGESRAFERHFISLLTEYKEQNRVIIYLSCDTYTDYHVVAQEELPEGRNFEIMKIDFDGISMR